MKTGQVARLFNALAESTTSNNQVNYKKRKKM